MNSNENVFCIPFKAFLGIIWIATIEVLIVLSDI